MSVTKLGAHLRMRKTWLLVVVVAILLGGYLPAFLIGTGLRPFHHLAPLLRLLVLAWPVLTVAMAAWWYRAWTALHGTLTANEEALRMNGAIVAKRRKLRLGYVMKEDGRTFVRLIRREPFARSIDIDVANEAEGNEILAALRLDPQSSVAEVELANGTAKKDTKQLALLLGWAGLQLVLAVVFLFVRGPHAGAWHGAGLVSFFLAEAIIMLTVLRRVVRVSVGADGLRFQRTLGSTRFVSYAEIVDVRQEDRDIIVTLTDDTTIEVHDRDAHRKERFSDREHEAKALVERIRSSLAATRKSNGTTLSLGRGGRTTERWIAAARALREQSATYRDAVVPDDQLWQILEDASASPTDRAGAALALRNALDEDGRGRLRVAAGACADKQLRVALESVAVIEDDGRLAGALEPLEDRRVMKLGRS